MKELNQKKKGHILSIVQMDLLSIYYLICYHKGLVRVCIALQTL